MSDQKKAATETTERVQLNTYNSKVATPNLLFSVGSTLRPNSSDRIALSSKGSLSGASNTEQDSTVGPRESFVGGPSERTEHEQVPLEQVTKIRRVKTKQ